MKSEHLPTLIDMCQRHFAKVTGPEMECTAICWVFITLQVLITTGKFKFKITFHLHPLIIYIHVYLYVCMCINFFQVRQEVQPQPLIKKTVQHCWQSFDWEYFSQIWDAFNDLIGNNLRRPAFPTSQQLKRRVFSDNDPASETVSEIDGDSEFGGTPSSPQHM